MLAPCGRPACELQLQPRVLLPWYWPWHTLPACQSRAGNPELLHLVDQRRTLQAKPGSCALRAADDPADCFERAKNQSVFGVPQSRWSRGDVDTLSPYHRQRIGKHAIV